METNAEGLTGILDALTAAIETARGLPMSSSVVINRAELLDLVSQAREILPEQLSHADELLASANTALETAQQQAAAMVAEADAEANRLVGSTEVVARANARAAEIIAAAEAEAAKLRYDADEYCDRQLADFEMDLGRISSQVRAGRAKLAERLIEELPANSDPTGA